MSDFVSTINEPRPILWNAAKNAYGTIKKGITPWGAEVSCLLLDLKTIPGQLHLIKPAIVSMRVAALFPCFKETFEKALVDFENLKIIHYTSMCFVSLPLFFKKNKEGNARFQLPQLPNNGGFDSVKFFYSIGGFCGFAAYFHKLDVCRIDFFTKASTYLGSILLFRWKGKEWLAGDTILFSSVCASPQELCFCLASFLEICRWVRNTYTASNAKERSKQFEWEPLLKLTASFSRFICLGCNRTFRGSLLLLGLDFVGKYSGVAAYMIRQRKERLNRFSDPIQI